MGEKDTCTVNLLHSVKNTKYNVYGSVGYRMIPPCSRSRYDGNCSPCFVCINSLTPTSPLVVGTIVMAVLPTEGHRGTETFMWPSGLRPDCQRNPDPGVLAPVHTLNYDTSIHVAFQNRKIFFF